MERDRKAGRSVLRTADGRAEIHIGDCVDVLRRLPDESIDTVLTSPPYWNARDYGVESQLGVEEDPGQYVDGLVKIFCEIRRILKPRGTIWLNIGDVYFRGPKYSENSRRRYAQGWNRNKQLSLIPYRAAIALQESGWIVRNNVVWFKPNAMPASVSDRLTSRWEPIFLLAKDEEYFFDLDRLRIPPKTSDAVESQRLKTVSLSNGKAVGKTKLRRWLNSPRHRIHIEGERAVARRPDAPRPWELASYLQEFAEKCNLDLYDIARRLNLPYERVRHYFRTDKIGSRLPPPEHWDSLKGLLKLDGRYDAAMRVEVGTNVIRNHPNGKNAGDVLCVSVEPFDGEHYATMPKLLAQTLLLATLPPSGVCLDPFCGSGTTGIAALALGGRFIGIDVVPRYCEMALARLEKVPRQPGKVAVQPELFEINENPR